MNISKILVVFLILSMPLTAAFALAQWGISNRDSLSHTELYPATDLFQLQGRSSEQTRQLFEQLNYHWPPQANNPIPAIAVDPLPNDLNTLTDVKLKKQLFFQSLLPLVLVENASIMQQRVTLQRLITQGEVKPKSRMGLWLQQLADQYRVKGDVNAADIRQQLLRRVDRVPAGLVLAQAANESGWGQSRFAREGNNLFGQWTYNADQGMVPLGRAQGKRHFVRRFPSLRASVKAYLYNLNVGHAYVTLRQMRAEQHAVSTHPELDKLDAVQLAEGLLRYSERGRAYVNEIQAMIRSNKLNGLDGLMLAARPAGEQLLVVQRY